MKSWVQSRKSTTSQQRRLVVAGFVLLVFLLLVPAPLNAASPEYRLLRLRFKNRAQLQEWVDSGLDVWHVEGNTALVAVPAGERLPHVAGAIELGSPITLTSASFPACYRTYDEMIDFLVDREARYPDLFEWRAVGESWETQNGLADRAIYAARLTNSRAPAQKSKFLLVAEYHAREIITPEVALFFIDDLLQNYGQDPTLTWLLDNREVWILPMANPDGYARAAQADNWRKNANATMSCGYGAPPNSYGIDLNRNYPVDWGGSGASAEPCNLNYQGEAPFSEPETQALRDLIEDERFDLIISLHSWGNEILYPWAHTLSPPPDAGNLSALASRMAAVSGYSALQAADMGYLSSGDAADWSYGDLGIPSFTFEVGGIQDRFWPPCDKREELYQDVRPALVYAALAADEPYKAAGGPEAHQIVVEELDRGVSVRAEVSDEWTGEDMLATVELFLGEVGPSGTGVALLPTDGVCNSSREWFTATLDDGVLLRFAGRRIPIFVVAEDVTGQRGVPTATWLDLRNYEIQAAPVVQFWMGDGEEPAFEIRDGYVYQGVTAPANVVLTVRENRVYRGAGTTGELLYTLEDDEVRVGEAGPVVYSLNDHRIYQGVPDFGILRYRVDYDRILSAGNPDGRTIMASNVNLALPEMEPACLLAPILLDRQY